MIASGSSALAIHRGSHDLSRRAIVYLMHTMSSREYLELAYDPTLDHYSLQTILEEHRAAADRIVEKLKEKGLRVLPLFQQYLEYGCYPYFKESRIKVISWWMGYIRSRSAVKVRNSIKSKI